MVNALCFKNRNQGETCGKGIGICSSLLSCDYEKADDAMGICKINALAGESCGFGVTGCKAGTTCQYTDISKTEALCFKQGYPGDACGFDADSKWMGPCISGTSCESSVCTDLCKSENKYNDGTTCDVCIKPDPDCYPDQAN